MKNGNWLAVREGVIDEIPSNRPASICDFVFIVTYQYRRKTPTSVALLAKRLCWSREKVSSYLTKVGLEIQYFGKKKNPTGGILQVLPREELDPKSKDIWIVQFRGRS